MNSCYEKRRGLNRVAISSTEEGDIACYAEASVASPSSALRNEERLDPKQLALRVRDLTGSPDSRWHRTRHRLILDGQGLYTWCAIDAVGIPAALSLDAQVRHPARTAVLHSRWTSIALNRPRTLRFAAGYHPPTA